jgi:methyl coenzyme M reductase beta subunit
MADNTKLALDKAGLQRFIDDEIAPFRDSLTKIKTMDNEQGPTMKSLLGDAKIDAAHADLYGMNKPLAIGLMAQKDDKVKGASLADAITNTAQSIITIYDQQVKLFKDLHDNLQKTIEKLMDGQQGSLDAIDGKTFLDGLGTVPSDFQNTGSGNSTA